MTRFRILAAAATALAFAFVQSPALARPCDDGNESCAEQARRNAPMHLDQFMKSWKPARAAKSAKSSSRSAAKSKRNKKQNPAAQPATQEAAAPASSETVQPADSETADMTESERLNILAASAEARVETDGVAVTSFNDLNELDAAADKVLVVAFNDVNEIDLAAPPAPAPAQETVGQAFVSPEQTPADNSWIGKLLLAVAGTIAIAGTVRLLVTA